MEPCAFTWEPPRGPYVAGDIPPNTSYHVCVLSKNHKGDHTSVDGERASNADEALVENLPMWLNLGDERDFSSHCGWARVTRDTETGKNKIEITLDEESSVKLGDMVDVFQLRAIGFAGIKRPVLNKATGEFE